MMKLLRVTIVLLSLGANVFAQTTSDSAQLTKLLKEFLDGASRNDAAIHDRFWADELVYTGSNGRRRNKADVMKDVRSAPAPKPGDPTTVYSAEDIQIQQHGNTAIVAFRLVGTTNANGKLQVANFFNTGTFIKRDGQWRVIAWQATRIPRADADNLAEVAAVEKAFHEALLKSDAKALSTVLDEKFIWTQRSGEQVTSKQLTDRLTSGELKYSRLETKSTAIQVYGDTAIVRGISTRQRSRVPNSNVGDAEPFEAYYTLTFVNRGGEWKAVAMHSSRSQN